MIFPNEITNKRSLPYLIIITRKEYQHTPKLKLTTNINIATFPVFKGKEKKKDKPPPPIVKKTRQIG